jgi:hypothetical protein
LVFTPFVIGASTYHEARGNANYGFQMSLSMPLDREAVKPMQGTRPAKAKQGTLGLRAGAGVEVQ